MNRLDDRLRVLWWIASDHELSYYLSDADRARLEAATDLRVMRSPGESLAAAIVASATADADAAVFPWGTVVYSDEVLAGCPELKLLARFGGTVRGLVGESAWERDIRIVTATDAMGAMIAELTMALIFAGLYRLPRHYELQQSGAPLLIDAGFTFGQRSLAGKQVGLVGFGTIAQKVAQMLAPFGCAVSAYDPFVAPETMRELNVTPAGHLHELIAQADILSLHVPDVPAARGMIDQCAVAAMKPGAVFVDTSWISLVDFPALEQRVLAGEMVACLDCVDLLYGDGPARLERLRHSPHCLITTMVGMHGDCLQSMGAQLVDELLRFSRGEPLRHEVCRETLSRRL